MVGNLNTIAVVPGDVHGVKLAMAGLSDMNANLVSADGAAAAPDHGAGMDDLQAEGTLIAGDAIVGADVGLGAVNHGHTCPGVVADHILGPRRDAVTAVQREVSVGHDDARASAAGDGHAAINVEYAVCRGDSAARAVLNRQIKDVNHGAKSDDALQGTVADGAVADLNASAVVDEYAAAAAEAEAVNKDIEGIDDDHRAVISISGRNAETSRNCRDRQIRIAVDNHVLRAVGKNVDAVGSNGR